MASSERVASLMEDVKNIVSGIQTTSQVEMVQSYAQMALTADSISERFCAMAETIVEEVEELDEEGQEAVEGLLALSEHFEAMSEEAAESAEALQECVEQGIFEEVNVDQVTEHFKGLMTDLLDGCDIYAGLTEDNDMGEDEEVAEETKEQAARRDRRKPDRKSKGEPKLA